MLDVMEERLSGVGGNPIKQDLYLGLLSVLEDLAVFGYVTNSNVKFLIFITVEDKTIKDADVKNIFRQIHDRYIKLTMNVFYDPSAAGPITNQSFLASLDSLSFHSSS
ncbi:Trafficking protein particle complex subunit 2-like protein [Kappamyces sp. JEL0829]|nr:Trafficking protein particle complex subunit 2-like protein [Kappamyces sp. JEL0829]